MSNINTIRLSGTTYQIEDSNASKTVELTQAQYDALVDKDPNTFYVITDAEAGDLTNYYTKTETDNAITAATSTKQDTLVSGTNIKTINNQSLLGSGNIDIQGGGGTVESAITSGSTNAVESKAIWSATTFNKDVLLTFNGRNSTNYPNGCTKLNVEVVGSNNLSIINFYSDNQNLGNITVANFGGISVTNSFNGATYEISGTAVIITYPTVSVTKIEVDNGVYVYKAVVEGAWVNENTYMKSEVDGIATSLQNNINSKLDATAYTPTVVDSQLNVSSTNPVQNQVLYDELVIEGAETETTLTFSADTSIYKSTNYPNGCTKVKVVYPTNSSGVIFFNNGNNQLGYATIINYGTLSVSLTFNGASYSIVDGVVVITYPTVTNVDNIRYSMYGTAPDSVEAVYTQTTHLIDQVTANTTALGGLSLVKLTQSAYDALSPNYDSNTLYVIVN